MATFGISTALAQDDFSGEFDQSVRGQVAATGSLPTTDVSAGIPMSPVGGQTISLGNGSESPPVGGGPSGPTYRMRAHDTTLGRHVFWSATTVDSAGASYGGPGPLTDVVIQNIIG